MAIASACPDVSFRRWQAANIPFCRAVMLGRYLVYEENLVVPVLVAARTSLGASVRWGDGMTTEGSLIRSRHTQTGFGTLKYPGLLGRKETRK